MLTFEKFKAESLKDPEIKREYDTQAEEFCQISDKIRAETHTRKGAKHQSPNPSRRPAPLKPSLA